MHLGTIATTTPPVQPAQPPVGMPVEGPEAVDTELVAGLRLPKVPGLPDALTKGIRLAELLAPPAPDSLAGKADLLAVKAAQRLRSPEGDAWAQQMDRTGATKVWFEFARQHRADSGRLRGWLDTGLLAAVLGATAGVTQLAKSRYDRLRPFQVDGSIVPPVKLPRSASYPSGHSSSAFAGARVIAAIAPELAADAYKLATQVAVSRVYAGVHFPTDVVTGALLGTGVADAVLAAVHRGRSPQQAAQDVLQGAGAATVGAAA